MSVIDRINSAIKNSGIGTAAVIINGRFMSKSGKLVYVEAGDSLHFYNKNYDTSIDGHKKYLPIEEAIREINVSVVTVPQYLQPYVDIQKPEECSVYVNENLNFVAIESQLYQICKFYCKTNMPKNVLRFGNTVLDSIQTGRVINAFMREALDNYRDTIYASNSNRFVQRIVKSNKFYHIQPVSFIPVFIEVQGLFNPLTYVGLGADDKLMFKRAIGIGRYENTGAISAYFLTHKEICECFGLQQFVRFYPSIWYNVFVGLLQPDNPGFPHVNDVVYAWGEEFQPAGKLYYTTEEFRDLVIRSKERPETVSEEIRGQISDYYETSSLNVYLRKELNKIKNLGPTFLDDKLTLAKLSELYGKARLL